LLARLIKKDHHVATATVRNVDDRDYAALGEIAHANGRSISEELRALIAEAARRRRLETLVAQIKPLPLPEGMTTLDLLREERDSW
jgi:plasmid stability protein